MIKYQVAILVLAAAPNLQASHLSAQEGSQNRDNQTQQGQEDARQSDAKLNPSSLTDKASYLIGYNVVKDINNNQIDINIEKLIEGIRHAAEGKKPPMSDEEITSVMRSFERQVAKQQNDRWMKMADDNQRSGADFLKKNAFNDGVKELEGGVQYQVISASTVKDAASPQLTDKVRVNYKGTFIDGTVFEKTADGQPASFQVAGVIRGFTQALLQMKEGDKWRLFIPGELAYGLRGNPPAVGPNQTLIFELELVEVVK